MPPASTAVIRPFTPLEAIGDTVPDVALVDQSGRRVSLHSRVPVTIVSFAYTRCPDPTMCSLVTAKFALLQRSLHGSGIRLVEMTLDPRYDRQAVLRSYARTAGARSPGWSLVTGNPQAVIALEERFGIVFDRSRSKAIGHTDLVALVSRDGTIVNRIDGTDWSASAIASEARALADLPSNPLQRAALRLFASASAACGGRGGGFSVLAAIVLFCFIFASIAGVALRLSLPHSLKRSSS